jgi:DNA primase large subunit
LIGGDKFAKEYAYNIRHMYGKEGKRVETKPMSCMNIILDLEKQPKPPTDCHGCPFKHSEPADLSKQLQTQGFQNDQIEDILQLSKMNRPDKASK